MDNPAYQFRKTIISAFVLFVIDAFAINQGVIAIIFLLVVFLFWLPKSAILKLFKQSPKIQLTKSLIFGVMAMCIFSANAINNKIAKGRADQLILAIERYHRDNSKYPKELNELTPKYILKVPVAKYTLGFNRFGYIRHDEDAMLFYVAVPPFGRPTYNFSSKKWHYSD